MTRLEYIQEFKNVVLQAVKGTGLFPSVMMAQAILESADKNGIPGNSALARIYNNHFGIKADKSWTGTRVNLKTREVFDGREAIISDCFRVYGHPVLSFKDRVRFLKQHRRYANAGVFLAPTPEAQAEALQTAGYATDPKYASILKAMIAKYELKQLDIGCSTDNTLPPAPFPS